MKRSGRRTADALLRSHQRPSEPGDRRGGAAPAPCAPTAPLFYTLNRQFQHMQIPRDRSASQEDVSFYILHMSTFAVPAIIIIEYIGEYSLRSLKSRTVLQDQRYLLHTFNDYAH